MASAVVRTRASRAPRCCSPRRVCRGWPVTTRVAPRLGVDADVLELDVDAPGRPRRARGGRPRRRLGPRRRRRARHRLPAGGRPLRGLRGAAVARRRRDAADRGLVARGRDRRGAPAAAAGASVVGADRDTSRAWRGHDWLGVARAALEATARYLARDLGPDGVRVNLLSCGPQRTMLSRALPGHAELARTLGPRALRSAGTRATARRRRAQPPSPCCRTGSRRRPAGRARRRRRARRRAA